MSDPIIIKSTPEEQEKRDVETYMAYLLSVGHLLREAAKLQGKRGGGARGYFFSYHMKPDGSTHTHTGPFSPSEVAEMEVARLRELMEAKDERITTLEQENAELIDMIPVKEESSGA